MTSNLILPFNKALEKGETLLARLAEQGQHIMGYFCSYTPIEIIDACGFVPIRLSGGRGSLEKVYSLVPDFICPFMKRTVERVMNGDYDFLSGIIQGYTCDAACGVTNILAENMKGLLFHSIPLPYNDSQESREFYSAGLRNLIKKLEALGGHFSEENLTKALDIRDHIRKKIHDLYDRRSRNELSLSAGDLWRVIQAGFIMPAEDYLAQLEQLMDEMGCIKSEPKGVPLLITGSLIEAVDVIEVFEELGGYLAADDLCSGLRGFTPISSTGSGGIDRLIDRHFKRSPCASRARAEDRVIELDQLIEKSKAQGIVFMLQKFCTPHLSDFPFISDYFKKKGIPCLLLEMDELWNTGGQFRTRLEGFFEMLR